MSDDDLFEKRPGMPKWAQQLAAYLSAAWPGWKPSTATMVVYYDALRDLDPKDIGVAARACVIAKGEFAPSAGQIRAEALKARRERAAHPPGCECVPCIGKLPAAERWAAMSPAMRTMIEEREPETAKGLVKAASQAGLLPAQQRALPTWTPRSV